jgi:hypothetical protein
MVFRFIFTATIFDDREELYVERIQDTIQKLRGFPCSFYIVENNGERNTKLDSIKGVQLLYTNTNSRQINKGMKEFFDILLLGEKYSFSDNDMIIKLTGLYSLEDSCELIEALMQEHENYDAFIKWYNICTQMYLVDDCIMGLYALRYRYLTEFNYIRMQTHPSMEHIFASHIRQAVSAERIRDMMHLGMYYRGDKSLLF